MTLRNSLDETEEETSGLGQMFYYLFSGTSKKETKSDIDKLLQATAKADEAEALYLAKECPNLIIKKESFQEEWCGQRLWKSISPLQYAAWAGDLPLAEKFVRLLPDDHLLDALAQLKEVKDEGMEWGPFLLPASMILDAYKEHSRHFDKWSKTERNRHWVREVGKAQLNSVVNLLQFMLPPIRSSLNMPDFNKPNRRAIQTAKLDLGPNSLLGSTCAIFSGILSKETLEILPKSSTFFEKASDTHLVKRFCEVRTKELKELIVHVEKRILKQEDIIEKPLGKRR